uniref:Uncharacterized protein n=1 Tax=Rhizophora mucronata TaxID=61149 RepID=A0A2P2N9N4_RHIMU
MPRMGKEILGTPSISVG